MKPLKVALGAPYPYNESIVHGGVEAISLYLVEALGKIDGLELHVVSCTDKVDRDQDERRGDVQFHWLTTGRRLHLARALTLDARRVRLAYEKLAPEVIHVQDISEYAVGAPRGVPLALTIHGFELFAPALRGRGDLAGPSGLYRRIAGRMLERLSIRNARAVVSTAGDYIPDALVPALKGRTIYQIFNPISDVFFEKSDQNNAGEPGVILSVGEIRSRKNQAWLVEAFAEVVKTCPEAKLLLAGGVRETSYARQVEETIARLGLGTKVERLGHLTQSEVLLAYRRSTVVVLPSIQETAPMAVSQAMAIGRPVVSTDVGGIRSMIQDGTEGYLVGLGDTAALADRLARLLKRPDLRESITAAGSAAALRLFSADSVARQTFQMYEDLARLGSR